MNMNECDEMKWLVCLWTQRATAKVDTWTFNVATRQYKVTYVTHCSVFVSVPAASVMYLNSMSVTWTARIQIFLTFSKLLAIGIIIVPGLYQLFKGKTPSSYTVCWWSWPPAGKSCSASGWIWHRCYCVCSPTAGGKTNCGKGAEGCWWHWGLCERSAGGTSPAERGEGRWFAGCLHCPVQPVSLGLPIFAEPGDEAAGWNAFSGVTVESGEVWKVQACPAESLMLMEPLSGFLCNGRGVWCWRSGCLPGAGSWCY